MKILNTLFILLITSFSLNFSALEAEESSLTYMKFGATHPPGDTGILPTIGLGTRVQKNSYGFDISLNGSSVIFSNYASLKGMVLYYPFNENNHFYVGFGAGVGYHENSAPLGPPYGSSSKKQGNVNLEAAIGYEFHHSRNFKTFIQLELTQPTFTLGKQRNQKSGKPGVAVTFGLGF